MARVKALTDRTIAERFAEIKTEDQLWGDITTETKQLAQRILGSALEDELQYRLQAGRYTRTDVRRGYRNGGYWRTVASRWGVLDVFQPRARSAQPPSTVLGRFQRRESEVDGLIRQAFLRGVSTRQVGAVLEPVLGWKPSAQTVSTIAKSLDQEVQRYHWRKVGDDWVYLLLDGVTMKVKHPGGLQKKLVLVAYGIRADGTRQLIDFKLAKSESQAEWESFLEDLHRRGLEGTALRLIATDGGTGAGRRDGDRVSAGAPPALLGAQAAERSQPAAAEDPDGVSAGRQTDLPRGHGEGRGPTLPGLEERMAGAGAEGGSLSGTGSRGAPDVLRLSRGRSEENAHDECH